MTTNIKGSDSNSTAHQCSPCASLSLEPRSHFDPYCVCGWHLDLLHLHGDIRHLRKNPPRIQLHDEPGSVWCWCFSAAGEIGKKFENSALMGKPLNTAISVRRCRKAWPEGRSIGRGPWPPSSIPRWHPVTRTSLRRFRPSAWTHFTNLGERIIDQKAEILQLLNHIVNHTYYITFTERYLVFSGLLMIHYVFPLNLFHFTNAWLLENGGWNPSLHRFEMHAHKCPSPRRWQRPRFEWLHFLQAPSHLVPELN